MLLAAIETLEEPNEKAFFTKLYRRYSRHVKKMILSLGFSDHDADDIMHVVFEKVIKYRKSFLCADEDRIKALLMLYVRCTCRDVIKKKKSIVGLPYMINSDGEVLESEIADGTDFTEELFRDEMSDNISYLLDKLSDEAREVIYRRYFLEMTNSEIAEKMGIPYERVGNLHSRALKKIRKEFEKEGYNG